MPRIARVVAVGLPHRVTQRGNNRSQVFFDDDDRRSYLWTLAQYRRKYGVEIWGYCLMDNHVHAVAVPREADSLARCFAGTNLIEPDWLTAELREQKYRNYLRGEPEEVAAEIPRMTATGRPLGGIAFVSALESRLGRVLSPQKPGRHHGVTQKWGKCPSEGAAGNCRTASTSSVSTRRDSGT